MAAPRVTLLEVARRAGVSRTTASFVMSGRTDMRISAEVSERVLAAARELDYRPNLVARGLRTASTRTVGLISDTIATGAFGGEVIRGSLATALRHDHLLFIGETGGEVAVEERLVRDLLDRGVDGFVYAATYTRMVRPSAALRGHGLVLLNCLGGDPRLPAVVPDELEAGRTAARALLEVGHRDRVWLVGETPPGIYAAAERLAGVREALSREGVELAGRIDCRWWPVAAHDAVAAFLAGGAPVTALICLNDRVAFGAYQALAEAGRRIPDDVSVVGFDDSDLAAWLRPQLSTVAIPYFELGSLAVELLLDDDRPGGVHLVPMPLRRRGSLAAPRPGRAGGQER